MSVRDTGILRKKTNQAAANFDSLLIIGYQSKIFHDDERALFIDQGRHLIGWMGNESLKIDRYDVRATLSDLTPYEAPPGGYSNRLDYLTPAEQKAEQLCEEERYYSLHTNEIEEEVYQEEILKRQKLGYGQVEFSYDGAQAPAQIGPKEAAEEEPEDDPFEPMPDFEIPRHIEPPDTMRLNAIIEKTARFIAAQGVQMEILIKAKQSNNPQFDFLNMNGRCNLYYKLLVEAIKEGRYPERKPLAASSSSAGEKNGGTREAEGKKTKKSTAKDTSNGEASLSLTPIVMPALKYVPSEDCAYTQLISKIQGKPISEIKPSTPEPEEKLLKAPAPAQPKNMVEFKGKSSSVEVKKISTGLMLAQCYNSDSEDDSEEEEAVQPHKETEKTERPEDKESPSKVHAARNLEKLDVPVPPEELRTIVDKTAAYVAKNGKDFEDILRTKRDPRFAFLDESSAYHRYYIYKVTGTIYIPASGSAPENNNGKNGTKELAPKEPLAPVVGAPVSFTIKALKKDEGTSGTELPVKSDLRLNDDSDQDGDQEQEEAADESLSVADLLEREERKEVRRVEERVRDKLAAAARERLGMVSKEKQLQQERKKKALEFLMKIKKNGSGDPDQAVATGSGTSTPKAAGGTVEDDDVILVEDVPLSRGQRRRSRSRSRSSHRNYHRRSRSRSRSRNRVKSKRKRSSPDRDRRHGRKQKKSTRRRSSSSDASRNRSRSRSRSRRSRDRSRHR